MKNRTINLRVDEDWFEEVSWYLDGRNMSEFIRGVVLDFVQGRLVDGGVGAGFDMKGDDQRGVIKTAGQAAFGWKPNPVLSKEHQTRGRGKKK